MSEQSLEKSLEKSDHELDIQRADCRSKFWQEAQAEERLENLRRMAERNAPLPPATGSAPELNREQREILYHTAHRAAGGFYCGGGRDMDALVAAGLMESAGRKSFVPDEYFRITSKGRNALRQADRNTHVAQPIADVLNKFSAEKGKQ